jgi:hypothetical protein
MKKQSKKETIDSLKASLRKRKYISILLALFTLGVNIFAWFAFSANAGLTLDATVASWDVEFKDENSQVFRNYLIEVTKMKPGMADFESSVTIQSRSDVDSDFTYEVTSFSLLGHTINLANKSDVFTYLSDFYPFSVSFEADKMVLTQNDTITFTVNVTWPYEEANKYFAQDEVYEFDDSFVYYNKSGTIYTPAAVANAAAFQNNINSLYLEKDDADTYFGMKCKNYETTSGQPCLVMNMRLMVIQSED